MADTSPMHMVASPIGVNFTNPKHKPRDDSNLAGFYDTLSDLVGGAINVPVKDSKFLTVNDWVYANRIQSGDI